MVKFTNNHGISLPMSVFLAHDDYDGYQDEAEEGKYISVTSLLKPIRQIVLSQRLKPADRIQDISELLASRLGQAIHKAIEDAWKLNYKESLTALGYTQDIIDNVVINPENVKPAQYPIYLEQRTNKKYKGWTISGKFDMVILGTVTDVKSTSIFSYMNQTGSEKYPLQGSLYRWLNPDIILEEFLNIEYLFKDWNKNQSFNVPNYPKLPVLQQSYPLLNLVETERWLSNRLAEIDRFMDTEEAQLPLCSPTDLWQKESVFKYYKKPESAQDSKSRSTKNFDKYSDAFERFTKDGQVGVIVEKKGEPAACKYCNVFNSCTQKDVYIADGSLKV